jgi:WbqC-like protein family
MIVSIHQPAYLPWLGYFHAIAASDLHIVLDHVQFEKNSFINRNKIRTKEGWSWLTVPVETSEKFGQLPINELKTANSRPWPQKHWTSLQLSYSNSACFAEHHDFFCRIYQRQWDSLFELISATTSYLLSAFRIDVPLHFSSKMKARGTKDELVLNLCREVGATTYLSGPHGRNYLRDPLFHDAGIKVLYHDYKHPEYGQAYPGFQPFMSAVDLLFNHGPKSREILMSGQEPVTE